MEKIEYQRLYEREGAYWWNVGRRRILEERLRKRILPGTGDLNILDVGCGAGGNILFLKKFGKVTGLDVSEDALAFSRNKGFAALVPGRAEKLPFPDGSFDIVATLDCIEHIEDDRSALRECGRVLKNNGALLLTAPAHRWLWSRHDEALHHMRRYTATDLRIKICGAGFRIKEMSHFVIPAIPFLLVHKAVRFVKKRVFPNMKEVVDTYDVELPRFLNTALIAWLFLEKAVMKVATIPFGSSLMVVAERQRR